MDRVREGTAGDVDLMDSVDRRTRGAAHLGDHELLLAQFRLVVTDHSTGSGYAYVDDDGSPVLVAATNRRTASGLMWEALASSSPGRAGVGPPHHRGQRRGRSTSGWPRGWRSTPTATCACGR